MSSQGPYDTGDLVRLSVAFTVSAAATDPTIVRVKYINPSGTQMTKIYGTDVEVVKDSTGNFHIDISPTIAGVWRYRWEGTGTAQAAGEAAFEVRPSVFT